MPTPQPKGSEPVNIIEKGAVFKDRISGYIKLVRPGIGAYYEKENGKFVKRALLPFNPLTGKLFGKYLMLKDNSLAEHLKKQMG